MEGTGVKRWLMLLRWPNLVIVALAQLLFYTLLIRPHLSSPPLLSGLDFVLLCLDTLTITAAGYVINDLHDRIPDQMNRPDSIIIGRAISPSSAWQLYAGLVVCGLVLSVWLGAKLGVLPLVALHPLATVLLVLYSVRLKGVPMVGNLVIALFCAGVPGLLLLAERQPLVPDDQLEVHHLLTIGYLVFAFLSTMYREGIKDLEDEPGDRKAGLQTAPVAWGTTRATRLVLCWGLLTLILLLYTAGLEWGRGYPGLALFVVVVLITPLVWSLWKVTRTPTRKDYTMSSLAIKIAMVGGLMYLGLAGFISL